MKICGSLFGFPQPLIEDGRHSLKTPLKIKKNLATFQQGM